MHDCGLSHEEDEGRRVAQGHQGRKAIPQADARIAVIEDEKGEAEGGKEGNDCVMHLQICKAAL